MSKGHVNPAMRQVEQWLAEKTTALTKAQAFSEMGLAETAQPLWAIAAGYEERIASMLDANGDALEAAIHRISGASCYQKAGDPSRAANLYRAALAGPLRESTRHDVVKMLDKCLGQLVE